MTKREIEIKVRLNQKEAEHLNRQLEKCRLSREAYLRHLIAGVVPREAPPPEYFAFMRELHYLFKATTPKGAQSQDPFWDSTASILLSALVYYLYHEAPPEEQNFPMVMEMLRAGEVREDDDSYLSPLDVLFERLEMRDSEHIAVKYYKQYRSGSAKTLKSIQITLASHMEKFNLDSLIALTATDELHGGKL